METIPINKANAVKAYRNGDAGQKKLLEELLTKEALELTIFDRVKTIEDVLSMSEITANARILLDYNGQEPDMVAARAYMLLTLIARVLNEGWIPDYTDSNQYKYFPYFSFRAGVGFSFRGDGIWLTCSTVGSRLSFRTAELAKYAATQFQSIYNDFLKNA